jgi:hypothetical protein
MFTSGDLAKESIEGQSYYTFQPNTIVYSIPVDSSLGKQIAKAKIGVVFHTTYEGDSFENMKAKFKVDMAKLKKADSVWYQDAEYNDVSGKATFTAADTNEVNNALTNAGKIFQKIAGSTLRQIEKNQSLAQQFETFNNTLVRKGERIASPTKHVNDLIAWFEAKFEKERSQRKSTKGKEGVDKKEKELMSFFSSKNRKNLELVFELQNAIVDAKLIIINKLDKVKQMKTFVRTKNGFKVTGSEGFVAIDKTSNGAVKLVDRLEFSTNNFSKDVIKGWER